MTICVGFMCSDGIVLASDTQETIADYLKRETQKIFTFHHPYYRLALTGAGDADAIDMTFQALFVRLARNKSKKPRWSFIQSAIHETLRTVHRNYLFPCPREDRPWISLLIAVHTMDGRKVLLKTSQLTIRGVNLFEPVGTGVALAHSIASGRIAPGITVAQAQLLALYILKKVKDEDPNCGKNSDVLAFKDDWGYDHIFASKARKTEEYFERFDDSTRPLLLACCDQQMAEGDFRKVLSDFCSQMELLRIQQRNTT